MISIQVFTFNPLQENTYVVWDETKEAVIVDPGCYDKEEKAELSSFIETNHLKPVRLLNTHCHVDHVLGNKFVKELYGVKLAYHRLDEPTHRAVKVYAPHYGIFNYEETEVDEFIDEGDTIKFGNSEFEIVFVPGHAPGHIAFYNKKEKICLSGDVLFFSGIGRPDLPGGDYETLISSIKTKLFTMDDDMVVLPGHGRSTTIGREKQFNPYLAGK